MRKYIILSAILFSFLSSLLHAQDWEKIGWNGGNTEELIRAGSSLFCATENDGVYVSTNDGESWRVFNTGLPRTITAYSCISLISSKNYLYLTSQDSLGNICFYKSSISDDNWRPMTIPGESDEEPQELWAGSGDTLLAIMDGDFSLDSHTISAYTSPDGGTTWKRASNGLPEFAYTYSGAANSAGLYLFATENDTATFETIYVGFFRSVDGGNSWTKSNNGLPDSAEILILRAFKTALIAEVYVPDGFSNSFDGIYTSTNSGQSWVRSMNGIDSASNQFVVSFYADDTVLYACMETNTYMSIDSGRSWIEVLSDYNDIAFYSAVTTPAGVLLCTHVGLALADDDISMSTQLTISMEGINAESAWLHYSEGQNVYGMTSYGILGDVLMRSDDAGGDWLYAQLSGTAMSWADWIKTDGVFFAGGYDISTGEPILLVSSDASGPWEPIPTLSVDGYVQAFDISGDTIVVGTEAVEGTRGFIHISTDAGETWKNSTPATLASNSEIRNVTIFDGKIYVTDESNNLFASSTGGKTWYSTFTGLSADLNVVSIFPHKGKLYLAGNIDLGLDGDIPTLYVTSNSGLSWTEIVSDLEENVYISQVRSVNGILYLMTNAGWYFFNHPAHSQLYVSYDDGAHWKAIGSQLPDAGFITIGDQYIFAVGTGGGYRIPMNAVSVHDNDELTDVSILSASVYPNPVTDLATITYQMDFDNIITLTIHDLLGREIERVESKWMEKGEHSITLNTSNWASGSYYVRLSMPGAEIKTVKVVKQ